jgi:hypothetical protein
MTSGPSRSIPPVLTDGSFHVKILDKTQRRELTYGELNGLNALAIPTWIYSQRSGSVSWANTEAQNIYFRKSREIDRDNTFTQTTLGIYARVEEDGHTVHIVGPRNILLKGQTDCTDEDIITLVVCPIVVNNTKSTLFQQVLDTKQFPNRIEVKADDTPIDIIMSMLDMMTEGTPVPAVYAQLVRSVLTDGSDLNQPIVTCSAFERLFPGEQDRNNRVRDVLGMPSTSAPYGNTTGKLEGGDSRIDSDRETQAQIRLGQMERMVTCERQAFLDSVKDPESESTTQYDIDMESWHFNAFQWGPMVLPQLFMRIARVHDLVNILELDEDRLWNFLLKINEGCGAENKYHNFRHAASVLHCINNIMTNGGVASRLSSDVRGRSLILLVALVAATIHDYHHLGVSNKFLVDTFAHLAILYNDKSPQENNHSSSAFQLMQMDEFNFMESFSRVDMRRFRTLVISMVLHTDMEHHFALLTKLKNRMSVKPDWSVDEADIAIVMQLVLKCADLSHLTYAFPLHQEWVNCLQEELFMQGDLEASKNMVISPMCDRTKQGIVHSQVDFFEFVAMKMFRTLTTEFKDTSPLIDGLMSNYCEWSNL